MRYFDLLNIHFKAAIQESKTVEAKARRKNIVKFAFSLLASLGGVMPTMGISLLSITSLFLFAEISTTGKLEPISPLLALSLLLYPLGFALTYFGRIMESMLETKEPEQRPMLKKRFMDD